METEDFSFPITPNNNNKTRLSLDSKPWWCVTYSSSSPEKSDDKQVRELEKCFSLPQPFSCCKRKSFSDMKIGLKVENNEDNHDENMDLLWEDFNEEVIRTRCGLCAEPEVSSRRMTGLGCAGSALRLAKGGGGKKPSVSVMIKRLKKLLLQNS